MEIKKTKKSYVCAEVEIVAFDDADVITTSNNIDGEGGWDEN